MSKVLFLMLTITCCYAGSITQDYEIKNNYKNNVISAYSGDSFSFFRRLPGIVQIYEHVSPKLGKEINNYILRFHSLQLQ